MNVEQKQENENLSGFDNKSTLRQLLAIAVPVALQAVLGFSVNLLDTLMLGSLGEVAISASALANQPFFILSMVIFGIVGGSNVLVAQFWGSENRDSISKNLAYTYRIAITAAIIATALGVLFPRQILRIFTTDAAVIEAGIHYMQIVAASYLFYTVTTVTCGTLRAVRTVRISLVLSATSLIINAILNWLFIFGNLGAPRLGILGAGIATSAARIIECALLVYFMKSKEDKLQLSLSDLLPLDKGISGKYFKNTIPVVLNELFWSVGTSILAIIMGRMGTEFVAANSIYNVAFQIAGVMNSGVFSAGAVMVGNTIGEANFDGLLALKKQLQRVAWVTGILTMLAILVMRPVMLGLYNVSELTLSYTNQIMYAGAFIQVFRTAQCMNMMGILRGAGDAKFVMFNDLVFLWGLAIPFGFLAGLVWKLPIAAVFLILNCEQVFKVITSDLRLRGNKWINNVTGE